MMLEPSQLARLRRRLATQLAHAPAGALVSISLDLGPGQDDWLDHGFGPTPYAYWSQPAAGAYRLGLGRAMSFATVGPGRFSALQAAFGGLAQAWIHDDEEGSGAVPAACLGFAFDEHQQAELPNTLLAVPAVLLESRDGRRTATFSCAARDGAAAVEGWLAALRPGKTAAAPAVATLPPVPLADRAWRARVGAALADIAAGRLDKVVLSRSVCLRAEQAFQPGALLAALVRRHGSSTVYGFGEGDKNFVGATPESLVALADGIARADALAGTAWLQSVGAGAASRLLSDDKNGREQRVVVEAVREAMAPLCDGLEASGAPEVLRLRELQHLRSRVQGRVKPGVGLFDLVARLHPTPAVGGFPTAAALDWLRRHGERRGAWYSGGVGWIGRNGEGEVQVALRCAWLTGREAELYAGAGIVSGSDTAEEWAETEAKLGTMRDAFAHPAVREPLPVRTGTR